MKIGFTGTQTGMSERQRSVLREELRGFVHGEFHHGLCIGADEEAHKIAKELQFRAIVGHPPKKTTKMMVYDVWDFAGMWVPKGYLDRNRDIVSCSERMIATPKDFREELRSGTWSTVRCARRMKKPLMIIFPNGTVKYEN